MAPEQTILIPVKRTRRGVWDCLRRQSRTLASIVRQRWFPRIALFYAAIGLYDIVGSQLVSASMAAKLPRVYDLVATTTGLFSTATWVIGGLVLVVLACIELKWASPISAVEPSGSDTFVSLQVSDGHYALVGGRNVSSVTDNGVGDISITFTEPLRDDYFVSLDADETVDYGIVERTPNSARIKFRGWEPARLSLSILGANP